MIVAESDSWFDYPFKKDVLDYLVGMGFAIKKLAKAGDTLENMVYGNDYRKIPNDPVNITHPGPLSLQETLSAIRKYQPKFVLLSAGGNDILGSELISFLHHKNSGSQNLLNMTILDEKLAQMQEAIEFFIKAVHRTHPNCHILMDGYDYPKINGKGYTFIFRNIKGPWIQPAMGAKAITDPMDQHAITTILVDRFNDMLMQVATAFPYFHYINLRGKFPNDNQWDNEIHLKNSGYKEVATIYKQTIDQILGMDTLKTYAHNIVV
ncbi:MAG TPA: SGNH/GDSL hydrolase family protein, partial [Saprospiraceae bacterium]|nr:SGNH/GDSL hydrolase family protein [Saprospiraceae bacterium]